MNLIPENISSTPNYWCTWGVQNYMYGQGMDELDEKILEGSHGAHLARASLNEENLFGENGWAIKFFPKVRSDLYIVLDDGWDVPFENYWGFHGSLVADEQRFPSCKGKTPMERLKLLNDMAKAGGWKGIGIWVSPSESRYCFIYDNVNEEFVKAYWRERLIWSRNAGVEYWKVDWGTHGDDLGFREMLTQLGKEVVPGALIEHGNSKLSIDLIKFSDVVRTYDVNAPLSVSQTLNRLAKLLLVKEIKDNAQGLINVEDEAYIGAVLACAIGVMRYPLYGLRPGKDVDVFFNGSREFKKRIDEITGGKRQRLAPAFGVSKFETLLDKNFLYDSWEFRPGDTYDSSLIGKQIIQSVLARMSRNMPLPEVKSYGEPPFVLACRDPNGVVAVGTILRTNTQKGWFVPEVDVTLEVGALNVPNRDFWSV